VGVEEILRHIDHEIAQLQRARTLLSSGASKSTKTSGTGPGGQGKKRRLTPEGRKRIAEAVKRRWEKQRKAAGK
jgi:hypothetical protein